jgi:CHAT domain
MVPTFLFISANPLLDLPIDSDEEIREIKNLAGPEQRFRFELYSAARLEDLAEALRIHQPHIVHFSSHGTPLGSLLIRSGSGTASALDLPTFLRLFSDFGASVRMVILNVCNSDDYARSLSELIECVFGIVDEVPDKAAIGFSKVFYRALVYGANIDEAYKTASLVLEHEQVPHNKRPRPSYRKGVEPSSIRFFDRPIPADSGLQVLARLATEPTLRDQMIAFRGYLSSVDAHLSEIDGMKSLHDWLHRLQLEFHAQLATIGRNFPDPFAADELARYTRRVRRQMPELHEIVRSSWIAGLSLEGLENEVLGILALVEESMESLKKSSLDDALFELDRVLGFEMPRLDAAIAKAASDLDLGTLAQRLESIVGVLPLVGDEPKKVRDTSVHLRGLAGILQDQVVKHGVWQRIDNDIRFVWSRLQISIESAKMNWQRLQRGLIQCCGKESEEWATQLHKSVLRMDGFVSSADKNRVLGEFVEIRQLASEQFAIADNALLASCDELRPLSSDVRLLMTVLA